MFSLKQQLKDRKGQSGFTIVELLIVIVVIGILATLVIVTFSGIQQKGRNSQRQTDINAIQGHVESYYAEKGVYPTYAQLNDATWRSANMKGLDAQALVDPKGDSIDDTAAVAGTYKYGYVALQGDSGSNPCTATGTADDTTCMRYTLTAAQEGNTTLITKGSN